jgi:hypothetical protein
VGRRLLEIVRPERRRILVLARKSREQVLHERCHIILLLASGMDGREVARALNVAPAHVSRTRTLYLAQGLDGLADRRCDNGHRKVTEEFRAAVTALLLKVPPDFGWMRPTWTRELLCLETERRGFERIAPCTMGRLLSALGARLGRPKPIVLCPWPRRRRLRILRKIRQLERRASAIEPVLYADEVDAFFQVPFVTDQTSFFWAEISIGAIGVGGPLAKALLV